MGNADQEVTAPVTGMRRATGPDAAAVLARWTGARRWPEEQGLDQWRAPAWWRATVLADDIRRTIAEGACRLVESDGNVTATITVDDGIDRSGLWTPEERTRPERRDRSAGRRCDGQGAGVLAPLVDEPAHADDRVEDQ